MTASFRYWAKASGDMGERVFIFLEDLNKKAAPHVAGRLCFI